MYEKQVIGGGQIHPRFRVQEKACGAFARIGCGDSKSLGLCGKLPPKTEDGSRINRKTKKESPDCSEDSEEAATYSPTCYCSTIGVNGLNFSVRNGKRWNPIAITT